MYDFNPVSGCVISKNMSVESMSLWAMAIIYIIAGFNHFLNPKFYHKIIPPFLPYLNFINMVSGATEVVLGTALLIPAFTNLAAWGIIILLIAIFPANIYHFMLGWQKKKMVTILAIRLPFQAVLIWWAYSFT